jgi:DNA excision repair protein ERCC-4
VKTLSAAKPSICPPAASAPIHEDNVHPIHAERAWAALPAASSGATDAPAAPGPVGVRPVTPCRGNAAAVVGKPRAPRIRPARHRSAARRYTIPADLSPEDLVAVIDSREQQRLDLSPLRIQSGALATGDYSVRGLESVIAIERKGLADLLACIGQERQRFHREVLRLLAYPVRALVVESTWPAIERGQWRSRVNPSAALGSILNWVAMGLPVVMAGDHARAGRYVSRILFIAARRRWREARSLWPACVRPERRDAG